MNIKFCFVTGLAIVLAIFSVAQVNLPIRYTLQIKGKQYEQPNYNNFSYIPSSTSYTFIDSAKLSYMAEKYVNMLFNCSDNDLLTEYSENEILSADVPVTKIIINRNNDQASPVKSVHVSDSIILIDNAPYMNRQGMAGYRYDTLFVEDPLTFEMKTMAVQSYDYNLMNQLGGFRFYENWSYDKEKCVFNKKTETMIPFLVYNRESFYEEELAWERRLVEVNVIQKMENASELFVENMVYDIRVAPLCMGEENENTRDFPDKNLKNQIVMDILANLREGKIKAYDFSSDTTGIPGNIDFARSLNYNEVIDSLSFTTRTAIGIDTARLRDLKLYGIQPRTEEIIEYQLDEWGSIEYPESNNFQPVVLSQRTEILGYDTVWYCEPKYNKVFGEIKYDTLEVYDYDEYGNYLYDEYGNIIVKSKEVHSDTIWKSITRVLDDRYEYYFTDKIYHNKLENIHSLRFYEDWYFDEKNFALMKKVKGIAFHTGEKRFNNETGNVEIFSDCKVYFDLN